jgi:subfamily B ATP-binding cassette protein HlyB/CyaB
MAPSPHSDTIKPPPADFGLAGLLILAQFHGIAADTAQLRHQFSSSTAQLSESELLLAAQYLGLKANVLVQPMHRLHLLALPVLALDPNGQHFVIARCDDTQILIHDFLLQRPTILSTADFSCRYHGRILAISLSAIPTAASARFDFTWFIPALVKYRGLLSEVMAISLVLQLLALTTPLMFQVVMDKVLVHQAYTTLNVIAIGMLFVTLFDVGLAALRTYVFSHTTTRIDVELGARLFRHLLTLPQAYFEARRVGDSVARVRELENIRQFITGQTLTTLLDLLFSLVLLTAMGFYSVGLTLIVLLSLPGYVIWSASITPLLRRRLDDQFSRGADHQAFLVETINSIGTIKAMAVEPQLTRRWDRLLAAYVTAGFRVTRLANIGQAGIQLIQKCVTVATLWLGAHLVTEGKLSVGQLIAFNMLAGQVAAPVLRLAQLWQDFQQVSISVARLGDILNTHGELTSSQIARPAIQGQIRFEQVVFRYRTDGPEILKNLDFEIAQGEIIGIIGRSGSGKSTLAKLVQRLYTPERGRVLIDDIDLALTDPAWLRRQIGVVLQENRLFNQSVRDNIALTEPGMPLETVIRAAKLAGAHDFIMALPQGYDTQVGEQGVALSGGQRQRLAIARVLVGDPRILIFDEATSALDSESEYAILQNMQEICQQRTVLIIAHRLSSVRQAHRIIAIDHGCLIESGTPAQLLAQSDSYYAQMYQLQRGEP